MHLEKGHMVFILKYHQVRTRFMKRFRLKKGKTGILLSSYSPLCDWPKPVASIIAHTIKGLNP